MGKCTFLRRIPSRDRRARVVAVGVPLRLVETLLVPIQGEVFQIEVGLKSVICVQLLISHRAFLSLVQDQYQEQITMCQIAS